MSGRSLFLIVVIAAAVLGGLFASGVISFDAGSGTETDVERDPAYLEGTQDGADEESGKEATGLAVIYGQGDMGAIKLRLVWVATSKPVMGQLVSLHGRAGKQIAEATSDMDGVVMFPGVIPYPRYSLRIDGEGFAAFQLRGIKVDVKRTNDLGDIMVGERIVLRGRVVSTSNKPLPGTSVSVHEIGGNMMQQGFMFRMAAEATSIPIPVEKVKTDDDGYFTFQTLQDGSYRLVARQGGYASKHQADVLVNEHRSAVPLTIVLGPGATARGTVKNDEGKPIAGAQVVALRDMGRRFDVRNAIQREVAVTDENGRYVIDTLMLGGKYRFGVIAEGYPTVYDAQGTDIPATGLDRDFELQPGGSITGIVVSKADGGPVAGAQVAAMLGRMGGRGQGSAQLVETDEEGRFAFPALLAGPVMSLSVKANGFITHSHSMWTGNQLPQITPGGEQDLKVELEPGGSIEGQVKDDGGNPLSGVLVSVMSNNMGMMFTGAPNTVTVEDGSFVLAGLPAGSYTVTAQADGFASAEAEKAVEVPNGGNVRAHDLRLTQAGRATGIVMAPDGEPLGGARVRARGREPEGEGSNNRGRGRWMRRIMRDFNSPVAVTDDKGRFTVKGLAPKMNWTLRIEHEDFVDTESKQFRVKAGEVHETEITMQVGASLAGVVVDEDGQRVSGARVQVGTLDPQMARRVNLSSWEVDRSLNPNPIITTSDGKYRAENLESGIIIIRVQKEGYVDFYRRNVRLTGGQSYDDYRVELSRGETLTGVVRGADGEGLANTWIALDPRTNPRFGGQDNEMVAEGESGGDTVMPRLASQTDSDGNFTIERIPPGTYSALIWFAPGHKSYRDESENAIQRGITLPGSGPIEMRLEAGGPSMAGRNNR